MVVIEILNLLLCIKNKKLGIRLEKIICGNSQSSYYNQEEWLEELFNNKRAFYDGSEGDDSDNNDEDYNANIEAVVHRCSK